MSTAIPASARIALVCLLATPPGQPAQAGAPAPCGGFEALEHHPTASLARVTGAPRTNFVSGTEVSPTCPDPTPRCRAKAFLVPGDLVVVGRTEGAFSCVDYLGAKGADRAGWLPSASLSPEPAPPLSRADWFGRWTAVESRIDIKAGTAGRLAIAGDATYGALDPERVKIGAVNTGEIAAAVAPEGDGLAFAMGAGGETLPVTAGDQYTCRVWMRRLGPYLLTDDNNGCGGFNVSFRGLYRRAP